MAEMLRRIRFTLMMLLFTTTGFSQLDVEHFLPPLTSAVHRFIGNAGHQIIYLSTPTQDPVNYTIYDGAGNVINSGTVSNGSPVAYGDGGEMNGANTDLMIGKNLLNTPQNGRGIRVVADAPIYCNVRIRSSNNAQAASITSKGRNALGTVFRIGHMPTPQKASNWGLNSLGSKLATFGIYATEDNTQVIIDLSRVKPVLHGPNAENTNGPFTITLQKGQTYTVAIKNEDAPNRNAGAGLNGGLITSNKPIAVNSGSMGGYMTNNYQADYGADQIVPYERVGTKYAVVRGASPINGLEQVVVVAHVDGTEIKVNGTVVKTINAGEMYKINGSNYVNGAMFVETNVPAYAYQYMMGSNKNDNKTPGMNFLPPITCETSNYVDEIPFIHKAGNLNLQGGSVNIVTTKTGADIEFFRNGVLRNDLLGNAKNVPGSDYKYYKISNLTGHIAVYSKTVALVSFSGYNNAAGFGGFYSGWKEGVVEDSVTCLPGHIFELSGRYDSYRWFKDGVEIPGEVSDSLFATETGFYQYEYTKGTCTELSDSIWAVGLTEFQLQGDTNFCSGDVVQWDIIGQGFDSISWNNGAVIEQQTVIIDSSGTTPVRIYSDIAQECYVDTSVVTLEIPMPEVDLRDTTVCVGESVTFDAQNPDAASWGWNTGETTQTIVADTTGEYSVKITSVGGCEVYDTINLVVHPCNIDLGVTKTDGREDYTPGTTTEYTIVVTNYGPYDAVDVTINDPAPVGIAAGDISWDATAYGGATSGVTGSQSGILNDVLSIPVGDSIVYSVNIAVPGNYKGDLINVVTISHPLDTNSSNDTAEDIDFNGLCAGSTVSSFAEQFNTGVKINPGENDPNWKIQWINDPAYYVYSPNNYATPISDAVIPAVGMNKAAGVWADASYPDYLWVCYPWTGPNNGPGKHIDVDGDGNTQEYDGGQAIVGTGDAVLLKFSKTFEMTPSQLEASEITFDIAADNHIMDIIVNGVSQGPKALSGYSLHPHVITQDFQLGSNTIEIVVNSGPGFAGMMIANSTIKAVDSVSLMITDPPLICAPNKADITDSLWTIGSINADTLLYFEDLTATQSLTNPTMVDSGTYTIVAINEVGCTDTAQIYVGQNPIADVELMPDTAFCLGGEVTINVGVYDSIVWSTGDITSSITVDSTNEYKVVVYNEFKCSDSDSVTITVHDLPIVTVRDTTICPGGTVRFEAVSVTATDYLWQKEGEGTTQTITDSIVGFYEVIVTDVNGCKDTAEAELTLHTPPVVEVNNDTICVGDPEAVFNATSATAVNYTWQDNGQGTSVSTSGIDAGDYTVIVEDINTCKDTATGVLVVDTLPIVELQGAAICDNVTSVDLTAVSATAVSYLWSGLGSGSTQTITARTQGNYVVTVTDENGCQSSDNADLQRYPMPTVKVDDQSVCPGGEATFSAVSPTATVYDWRQNGTGTAQTTVGSIAGIYEVIVEDINGCKDTAEAELIIYVAPEVTVEDNRICIGDAPAIFEATSTTATSYSWSEKGKGTDQTTTGTDAGNYTVIITDINSCKDTATGVLVVDTLPVVSVEDITVCSNTPSVDLKAISTTAQVYDWTGTVTGNTSILTVSEPGNYVVTVTDENGCQQSANADLIHIQQPEDFEIQGELVACEGDEIELSINVTSQFKNWSTGEQGDGIVVDQNGTYSVTVANEANGIRCEASNSINPIFLPYADQPNEPYIVNCFDHYQEIPVSFETNATIDWGDLTISRDNELLVTEPGIYSANIYLHEQCQITANLKVEEFCPYTVFVPNAFTPNGDGRNETFEPKVNNIIDYKLYIFNRWGDLIFTSNHEDNQWDGTYLGNPVQIDVYVYKLIVTGNKSMGVIEEQQFVGTVSLIR